MILAVANLGRSLSVDVAKLSFLYYSSHLPVQNEDRQKLQFEFSPFREALHANKRRDFIELILDYPECPDLYLHANSSNRSSVSLIRLAELLMKRFPGRSDIFHRALRIFPQHDIPYESRFLPRQSLGDLFFATDQQDIYHQCKYDWSSFFMMIFSTPIQICSFRLGAFPPVIIWLDCICFWGLIVKRRH
ncbi:hypothetical protein AAF134_01195 [Synechococcus lacustris Tous-12m]